ncbi:MAG TPA: VOC family protein [Burkholderiaceae bacterium]
MTSHSQVIPYLSFPGKAAEAMQFYAKTLRGELLAVVRAADMPPPAQEQMCGSGAGPALDKDFVVHAAVQLPGGGLLYAGDCPPGMPYEGIKGVSLTIEYPTVAEARSVFDALAEGGRVTMPMGPQFWAKAAGMLVDRYGTAWIVNGERTPT